MKIKIDIDINDEGLIPQLLNELTNDINSIKRGESTKRHIIKKLSNDKIGTVQVTIV